ncbi:hypothetical protein GDO78_000661 [Eleutherodactylus coqui]|uniref:Rab-GAP TBC domain-containing protein n=1 Tax=Eleutherodactylus coqui TaxID=57060 RepID=A0A8J6KHE2_ELECQ|nr:hypothetical protein GDO78_000661 [Eleutherodactylus coqui]
MDKCDETAKDRIPRVDAYGFERPDGFDYAAYEEFYSQYLTILTRRAMKWSKMMQKSSAVEKSMKVKRYIRKGIPNEHRCYVWMIVSGAQAQMEQNPGYYHSVLQEGQKNAKLVDAVVTDGMNFITGILILVAKEEEKAFWLLDALVGHILPDYYSPTMMGLKTDQEVLGDLVKMKIPAVAELIDRHGLMWTLLVSRWFICLFIDILPVETVLRIWDCLFYEGSKVLFRVALTLIKHYQSYILEAKNFPDVCDKFKDITKGPLVTECHLFMQKIFTEPGSLSRNTIFKLREHHAQLLTQE